MRWGIDVAEELCVPIYLEASAVAIKLYRRLGFQQVSGPIVRADVVEREEDFEIPVMVKMPTAAKGMTLIEWVDSGRPALTHVY
jgi:hypothetical protein